MSTQDNVVDNFADLKKAVNTSYETSKKEVKKSGKDWLAYVEQHPLQTMLFGIIGYFAIKGMID